MAERVEMEKILGVLRPYAANWSGSLGRGDLVVPQREIPRLIEQILEALQELSEQGRDVSDAELFRVFTEIERLPSVQDQIARLRASYRVLKR
jgi:hypothetical protein